jgi:hypothetical protein
MIESPLSWLSKKVDYWTNQLCSKKLHHFRELRVYIDSFT